MSPQLVGIVNELYSTQVITPTGGNVSVRLPDRENEIWITPSQLFKGDRIAAEITLQSFEVAGEYLNARGRSTQMRER